MASVSFSRPNEGPDAEIPGEQLARQIARRMEDLECEVSTVDLHDDYGWSWVLKYNGTAHYFVLAGNRDGTAGEWLIDFRPRFGIATWLKPGRYAAAEKQLTTIVARILESYDASGSASR